MERILSMGSTSTSVVYGNVGHSIKEMILERFPKDLIKDCYVSSEIGYRSIKKFLGSNSKIEMRRRQKPYLVIQPQFLAHENGDFMNNSPLGRNIHNINGGIDKRFLSILLDDSANGFRVSYRINHEKIAYDCKITVGTLNEQLDLYNNMRNNVSWDISCYYMAAIESQIPMSVMKYIGGLSGFDLNDPTQLSPFLTRVNSIARQPITYKVKNSSSNDEYFMYYNHNLIVTFTDLERGSVNKRNMVDDSYDVTFRVEVEFNMPAMYFIQAYSQRALTFKMDIASITPNIGTEYIPICSIKNIYSLYPPRLNGMQYYISVAFHVDDTAEEDTLELHDSFIDVSEQNITMQHILENAAANGESDKAFLKIFLLKDYTELKEDVDYTFDFLTQTLKITNLDKYATYRAIIYTNNAIINTRRDILIEEKNSDKSKLK